MSGILHPNPEPAAKWTELVRVHGATGERESLGQIVKKRTVGRYHLVLTYDEPRTCWWVVIFERDVPICYCGFYLPRREDAWAFFLRGDEDDIAAAVRLNSEEPS